mgnify:FL=1
MPRNQPQGEQEVGVRTPHLPPGTHELKDVSGASAIIKQLCQEQRRLARESGMHNIPSVRMSLQELRFGEDALLLLEAADLARACLRGVKIRTVGGGPKTARVAADGSTTIETHEGQIEIDLHFEEDGTKD